MRNFVRLSFLLCLVFLLCLPVLAVDEPVQWRVSGINRELVEGNTLRIKVVAVIAPGWHLYSTKEIAGGPKATRFELSPGGAWEWAGAVEAPEPLSAQDTNFGTEVEYYEDEAEFLLPLRLKSKDGESVLRIRYQCCTDKECLPPKTVSLRLSPKAPTSEPPAH